MTAQRHERDDIAGMMQTLGRQSREAAGVLALASSEQKNAALKAAADGPMKRILQFCTDPLVSIDFRGNSHSSIVDAAYTKVMDNDFLKVMAWYDNEWGYSSRCVDLLDTLF